MIKMKSLLTEQMGKLQTDLVKAERLASEIRTTLGSLGPFIDFERRSDKSKRDTFKQLDKVLKSLNTLKKEVNKLEEKI